MQKNKKLVKLSFSAIDVAYGRCDLVSRAFHRAFAELKQKVDFKSILFQGAKTGHKIAKVVNSEMKKLRLPWVVSFDGQMGSSFNFSIDDGPAESIKKAKQKKLFDKEVADSLDYMAKATNWAKSSKNTKHGRITISALCQAPDKPVKSSKSPATRPGMPLSSEISDLRYIIRYIGQSLQKVVSRLNAAEMKINDVRPIAYRFFGKRAACFSWQMNCRLSFGTSLVF